MEPTTHIYQIDSHKQLIPLNGVIANFSCFFEVRSKDEKPFYLTIVDESELKPKEYKSVDSGYINGTIRSDGTLKTYFLVLKSKDPCECEVKITLQAENGFKETWETPTASASDTTPIAINNNLEKQATTSTSLFQLKYIIGISVILIVVYLIYRYKKIIFKKVRPDDIFRVPSDSVTTL